MDVCKLEDFKHAFMLMDELIENEINSGNDEYKETDPLIVRLLADLHYCIMNCVLVL